MGITYRDAGVDVDGGNRFVKRIAPIVKATFSEKVITDIGGFGALYSGAFPGMEEPVLVSGTDGVGTKLKIAQMMNKHDTIGVDAVAMCVNDILVSGAAPLFFLDYIACGRLHEDTLVSVVSGIAHGCTLAGCSLVGGETAEHPAVMAPDEYDIAGFSVGVVDRKKIINGSSIKPGDVIIGLPSSGLHSNGYSLARKLLFDIKKYSVDTRIDELGSTLGEALLTPTRIYCKSILGALSGGASIKGMVHITGGGFYENIPRILPEGAAVRIELGKIHPHPLFPFIQREGAIEGREMYTTFNMGIGLMIVVTSKDADSLIAALVKSGEAPAIIGDVIQFNDAKVILA
ncbi:MAG: phosphoribosylformylglycinamidine cyclo-ligase [Spirochaetes bacterium]|nr:MAG: phosphoribosylformylglycinamidine cyclo-ligase [Spirochaetota bacterium]